MSTSDKDQPGQTLTDYVGIVIAPVLVMTLVGSLVFFLLEICYAGDYVGRMRWTMFFFVFGIVLVCRIAMLPEISDRSWLYGLLIAGATWLCLQGFINYPDGSLTRALSPLINLGLIIIVWWSASKLVRDCTNVDEDTDMSGQGVLQASGLENRPVAPPGKAPEPDEDKSEPAYAADETGIVAWVKRYQHYRKKADKKRTLGVWVVYFSLAALPLFGLGQALIPSADGERRRYTFWLLVMYVASGLGLLMTTCFLGLRRYLRQRRLRMPAAMTGVWLVSGVTLIVVLLTLAALLPRPDSEYAWIDFQQLRGKERSASNYATKSDSPGKGSGKAGQTSQDPDGKNKAESSRGEQGQGSDKADSKSSGERKGQGSSGKAKGDGQKGSGEEKSDADRDSKKEKNQKDSSGKAEQTRQEKGIRQSSSRDDGDDRQDFNRSRNESTSAPTSIPPGLANALKWIVFAIVALVTLVAVLFAIVRFLANFTGWAARFLDAWSRFWARLFGPRKREGRHADEPAIAARPAAPPRPFSSYHNPFQLGQRWSPYEFCCYTFSAFEAWARERGVARQTGETPLEHAERVGNEIPAIETDARRLALIYARGVYGSTELPAAVNDVLREVWDQLDGGAQDIRTTETQRAQR